MVSTFTAAVSASCPTVIPLLVRDFNIVLDSVLDYGSNVTPLVEYPEGEIHGRTAKRARRTGSRRLCRDPGLDLLPRSAATDHARFQRCLDRQPDGTGTVPPGIHRHGAGCAVLRVSAHLPPRDGLRTRRGLG